jgi:hypothetical protein
VTIGVRRVRGCKVDAHTPLFFFFFFFLEIGELILEIKTQVF